MQRESQDIQEGHGTICPGVFIRELNTLVCRIDVIQKVVLYADLMTVKVSSTYLFHREGSWRCTKNFHLKIFHI